MLWQVRWNTVCHKLLGFISHLSAKEPVEVIWEGKGPFRKNTQCDYKNFLSNSIKVNLIYLLHLEPAGNCSVSSFEASSATRHASLHRGVKHLAKTRALGTTLSSLNEEMKSSWDELTELVLCLGVTSSETLHVLGFLQQATASVASNDLSQSDKQNDNKCEAGLWNFRLPIWAIQLHRQLL